MLMQTIGFVLSISGLFLLPNTAFFQNKEVTIAFISIIALLWFSFFNEKCILCFRKKFSSPIPVGAFFVLFTTITYLIVKNTVSIKFLFSALLVFAIPTILAVWIKVKNKFHWTDIFLLLFMFAVIKTKIIALPFIDFQNIVAFKLDYLVIVSYLLWLFLVHREMDLGLNFKITGQMFIIVAVLSIIMIPLDLFLAVKMKFIDFGGWDIDYQKLLLATVYMFFFGTLIEEFFFRGLIHNYFAQYLQKSSYVFPLIVSSVFFGITHLDSFGLSMLYLSTIAGFFYGLTYIKTKNLFCSVMIHTLTNVVWQIFFITKG